MDIIHKKQVTAACGCISCVNFKEPQIHRIYKDKIIYFCSRFCLKEFNDNPMDSLGSDHFKLEFDIIDNVQNRLRENVSEEEIDEINEYRKELEEDGFLIRIKTE